MMRNNDQNDIENTQIKRRPTTTYEMIQHILANDRFENQRR